MPKETVERPWGKFEQFTLNEPTTIKLLYVDPNQALSLQYHNQRTEFWKVVEGSGQVVIGDETLEAKVGDEFNIPLKTHHRIITSSERLTILEISYGHFDEKDNIRLEDKYGRKGTNN